MSPFARSLIILAVVLGVSAAFADPKPSTPTKDQIAKWIKQLGDADFDVRQKASEEIWNATDDDTTPVIEAALKEALKSDDAEVVRRASEIFDRLQSGINAKTPKKIVDLVERFRGMENGARQEALKGLFESGTPGLKILLKLIDTEKDPATKEALGQQVATEALAAILARMAEGDRASVEQLLDLSLHGQMPAAQTAYAAYWLRRGKLPERIRIQEAIKPQNPESHAFLLATLYRVQGDYPKARAAAEKSNNEKNENGDLRNAVLFDQGDWKELADRTAKAAVQRSNEPNVLGLLARYQRLAGDVKSADESLARIRESAKQAGHEQCARALLLNGRPNGALELISSGKGRLDAVEMYCARYQFKDALKILDAKGPLDGQTDDCEVLHARTLYLLGDHENAVKRFTSLGEKIGEKTRPLGSDVIKSPPPLLIPTEMKLGLKDLAYQHTAALVTHQQDQLDVVAGLMEPAFPEKGSAAAAWWKYLRLKHLTDEPADTMKRLREILEGRLASQELSRLAEDEMRLTTEDISAHKRVLLFLALAESNQDAGDDGLTKSYLEKAVEVADALAAAQKDQADQAALSNTARMHLADYYASKKDWTHAAEHYGHLANQDRKQPLSLFLRGYALVTAGQVREGKRLIELSHDLPLADAEARYAFARELDKRGHADAARLECELIIRINGFDDPWHTEEALKALAQHARAEKNYAKAADYFERSLLCHLHGESEYRQAVSNLVVPATLHYNRAMAFLTADKLDDAEREIQSCLDILPGDINLPILMAPELEKKGHKKEAADLFTKVWAVHEGLCKDYPKSAWGHNNIAWLAVRCRRNLDEALNHAKLAVELAPDNAGYLDTLGEVYFQKGDKEKALELTKKCIKMDPKYAYFQRQLKRIETGDPKVDVPE